MPGKMKILFLAANPMDAGYRLRLDEEAREIDEKIQGGSKRDAFEIVAQWAVRPADLQKALLRHSPHIVHFSGHGSKNQGIILEDKDGNMMPVDKKDLIDLFRILKDNIQVIFLNACHSRRQIGTLQEIVDFTIVMRKAVGDQAAVVFASHFYQALAFGRSIREAFELAKNQLGLLGIPESKTPELLVREGADAAKAYLVKKTKASGSRQSGTKSQKGGGNTIIASGKRSFAAHTVNGSTIVIGNQNQVRSSKRKP